MNRDFSGVKWDRFTNLAMEMRALVLGLALTLPLALYGIPYAYAATTSSSYVVESDSSHSTTVQPLTTGNNAVLCNPGDYATGALYMLWGFQGSPGVIAAIHGTNDPTGNTFVGIGTPHGVVVSVYNPNSNFGYTVKFTAGAICQTPITVAGIGVPEFGSLYVAIALGAVLYFLLSKRFTRRPTISGQVKA
jgi:hypothetical protein